MPARFRSVERWWAIAWAVLQFALPAAASYADARIERASGDQPTHVEASTSPTCLPVHSADCGVCHLLSQHLAPAAALPALLVGTDHGGLPCRRSPGDAGAFARFDAPARAPPAA